MEKPRMIILPYAFFIAAVAETTNIQRKELKKYCFAPAAASRHGCAALAKTHF